MPRTVTRPKITPEGLKMRGLKNMARPPAVGNEEGVVVYVHDPATQNLIARQEVLARKHLLRRDIWNPSESSIADGAQVPVAATGRQKT